MLNPKGCRRLVVYGGSFDPPHRAHVELPFAAAAAVGADGVLFVPAGQPPHKSAEMVSPAADRVMMLKLALGDRPDAAIWTWELQQPGPSYTVSTLEELTRELPGVELRLLIGADMMAMFYEWRQPRRIIGLAEPVVMMRPPYDVERLMASLPRDVEGAQRESWRGRIVPTPVVDIASTRLRELLRRGAYDDPAVSGALHPEVLRYIRERGLYRAGV